MAKKKQVEKATPVNWPAIENDYRAGIKTLRHISDERGITHVAIIRRAKRDGWTRNLQAKILAKADELVTKGAVTKKVTKQEADNERTVIDANAEALANVIRGHRSDVARLRAVLMILLGKCEVILLEPVLFEQLGDLCNNPDANGVDRMRDLYRKVIDLPTQTALVKQIAETMKILIELERKIFKLETMQDDPGNEIKPDSVKIAKGVQVALDALELRLSAFVLTS